ncbi:hypothetical protein E1267_08400 [Nonomuraea longispora]|uniref:Uncharacterized protein n=1 Tax=Nonomuraea longispora TaxID=1848320 RepID=A0A4R4NMT3_9ACTN|nr:hypothetical protein [Nonomuraea longispora]TDC09153.1 hypothetical protein E1267_08400 [Nonomuraea longispora]
MPNHEEFKDAIYSEIQALEVRTQAAEELQGHVGDGGWDESVAGVVNGYHDSVEQWGARLSSLLAQVEQARPVTPGFDFGRFAEMLDAAGRRMENVHEQLAEQTAIAQEELVRRLAAAQDAVRKENGHVFRELAEHVRQAGRPGHSDSEPERNAERPEEVRDDEPPESPDLWNKS